VITRVCSSSSFQTRDGTQCLYWVVCRNSCVYLFTSAPEASPLYPGHIYTPDEVSISRLSFSMMLLFSVRWQEKYRKKKDLPLSTILHAPAPNAYPNVTCSQFMPSYTTLGWLSRAMQCHACESQQHASCYLTTQNSSGQLDLPRRLLIDPQSQV
jgi:hypothetical protein